MKPLVIYHANCADGFGAAFAAWLRLGDSADYVACRYGEVTTPADFDMKVSLAAKDNDVYILDFSFPREVMDALFAAAKRVVWLDHHKTAFEMWGAMGDFDRRGYVTEQCGAGTIILDNNRSGALIAWEYFCPGTEVPKLIQHIDDYDRWQFRVDGTKEFSKALWSYAPWSFEQWKREFLTADMGKRGLSFEQTARYSGLIKEGAAILRAHDQNVQSVVKGGARKCSVWKLVDGVEIEYQFNLPGLAANCPPHLTSDVGHELAVQSGTFGLCWTLNKTKMVANCSLRSNGDYDVSAVAKAFGGGGHRNASGMEIDIQVLLSWLR